MIWLWIVLTLEYVTSKVISTGLDEVIITCDTGSRETSELRPTLYSTSLIPNCNQSYLPAIQPSCGLPGEPQDFHLQHDNYQFSFTWRAMDNMGGSFGVLKGFKFRLFLEKHDTAGWYKDCFYIDISQPHNASLKESPTGVFTQNCTYQGQGYIRVVLTLYSYPDPLLCRDSNLMPKRVSRSFTLSRKAIIQPSPSTIAPSVVTVKIAVDTSKGHDIGLGVVLGLVGSCVVLAAIVTCIVFIVRMRKRGGAETRNSSTVEFRSDTLTSTVNVGESRNMDTESPRNSVTSDCSNLPNDFRQFAMDTNMN